MNYTAFFSYIFLTAFTPGPNNILSMSNAGKYGLKKSFPFNLGILAGFLLVMTVSAAFSALLYDVIPAVEPVMRCVGAAYILWLAWSVWRDRPHAEKERHFRTNTFVSGMVLQFINIKVILYGITAMSSFVLPYDRSFSVIVFTVLLLSAVGFAGTCCWAVFGAVFERFFRRYSRIVNAVMALALVYCAVAMLPGIF